MESVVPKVKILFSRVSKEVKTRWKEGKGSCVLTKSDLKELHHLLYLEVKKQKSTEYLVRLQYDILVDFLQDKIENLENLFSLLEGYHLMTDVLHLLFYHANQKHFHFYSEESILSRHILDGYLETQIHFLKGVILDRFQNLLRDQDVEGNKRDLEKVLRILSYNSPKLYFSIEETIFDFLLRRLDESQDLFQEIIDLVRSVRVPFKMVFRSSEDWEKFISVLRSRHLKGKDFRFVDRWIRSLEEKSDWEDVYEFGQIAGFQDSVWCFHYQHFLTKWKKAPLEEIIEEVEFQKRCCASVACSGWKTVLEDCLSKLFQYRLDCDTFVVEKIHQCLLDYSDPFDWMQYTAYSQDKDKWLGMYQEKFRERLVGLLDFIPCMDLEKKIILRLETVFGRSSVLNLHLMLHEACKSKKGNISVLILSKFAWGISENPFHHVSLPQFLKVEKIPQQSFCFEFLLHLGSVVLQARYGITSIEIIMYPIQAVLLIGLQENYPVYADVEEVYQGLERDGLIESVSGVWRLSANQPSIRRCSKWEERLEKPTKIDATKTCLEDYHLDAFLCRIAKNHGRIAHEDFLNAFLERFNDLADATDRFYQRIEKLIEREFIEKEGGFYNYIP